MISKDTQELLILTGSFNILGHNERIKGFLRGLKEKKVPFEILETKESLDDDEVAFAVTTQALAMHRQINCIFIAAAGVEGACKAVIQQKREGQVKVLTFDDIPSTKKLVKENIISFTLCQDPMQQGYQAIQKLFAYMIGNQKNPPTDSITNTIIKIRENIED